MPCFVIVRHQPGVHGRLFWNHSIRLDSWLRPNLPELHLRRVLWHEEVRRQVPAGLLDRWRVQAVLRHLSCYNTVFIERVVRRFLRDWPVQSFWYSEAVRRPMRKADRGCSRNIERMRRFLPRDNAVPQRPGLRGAVPVWLLLRERRRQSLPSRLQGADRLRQGRRVRLVLSVLQNDLGPQDLRGLLCFI